MVADRAYIGAGSWVTTAVRRPSNVALSPTEQTLNRALTRACAPVERGDARLTSWRAFRRSGCSPNRIAVIASAVLTLERRCWKGSVWRCRSVGVWAAGRLPDRRLVNAAGMLRMLWRLGGLNAPLTHPCARRHGRHDLVGPVGIGLVVAD